MKINIHSWHLAELFVECKMFRTKVVEKIKTHFMLHNFFSFENRVCFSDNVQKYCRAEQAKDDSMANAHCVFDTKATKTHSECVILIAFALQHLLHECAPVLHYTYIAWLVKICHCHWVMSISFWVLNQGCDFVLCDIWGSINFVVVQCIWNKCVLTPAKNAAVKYIHTLHWK
jgi:hypothetical protein